MHKAPLREEVELRIVPDEKIGMSEARIWYKDILTDVYHIKNSDLKYGEILKFTQQYTYSPISFIRLEFTLQQKIKRFDRTELMGLIMSTKYPNHTKINEKIFGKISSESLI